MAKLTIDGQEITARDDATIIEAAHEAGIVIPHYCYHPKLSIAGNCRMCLVELEGRPKLEISCNTPVADDMVVHTNSPPVVEGRRGVLEFLLINHPLDCPICDQAGECGLQDYYMTYGQYQSRFQEEKVHKRKVVDFGPDVIYDAERCILCTRCVRFCEEITKTNELQVFYRGDTAETARTRALRLPANLHARVQQLANQWRQASRHDPAVVERALRYFREQPFVYTLTPPGLDSDPTFEFLFQTRRGYCEHFASSFTVLRG